MLTQADARRRITLPTDSGIKQGDTLQVEILEDGRIMLIPIEAVPRHQLWAWTTENKEAINHSLTDHRPSITVNTPEEAAEVAQRWSGEG